MLRNRYGIVGIEIILEIACDDVFGQSGGSIRIGALDVVEDIYVSPSQIRRFGLRTGDTIDGHIRSGVPRRQFEHLAFQPRQALPIVPCVFAL